jgi:hypothetical protein
MIYVNLTFNFEEACKAYKRILYISSSTKQIIIETHIYNHISQINISLRKLEIAYVAFI